MGKWEMVRLGDVFTSINNGASIKQGDEIGSGIPITRIETISDGTINRKRMGYAGITNSTDYANYILCSGDILMSHINSTKHLGKTALYKKQDNEVIIHGMNLLRLQVDKSKLNSFYASFYFDSLFFKEQLPKITKNSVNQSSFTVTALKELTIPLPSLDIQQKIADVLDKASALIELRKAQLDKLDLLIKSQFIDMFGDPLRNLMEWPVRKLKDITETIQSGNTPKGGKQVYVSSGIMFFRSQNVWRNKIELDDIAYIDEKTHQKMNQTSLRHKDILITKTGRFNTENSSLGRAALYLGKDGNANINGHVYLVRLKEGVRHEFVLRILVSDQYRDYIRKVCVGGIDKRQINKEHLEEFPIIVPPLELQNRFTHFVEKVDKSKFALQQSLEKLERNYKSLMQKCFRGEIF